MDEYAMYLRKSRYDRDFSENSLEETLHRHKTILEAYAKKEGLHIAAVLPSSPMRYSTSIILKPK
mgnify:CR=1 FL=1